MVNSIELVVFGGFLLVAGLAITANPTLGEFNIGNKKIERGLGIVFGVLSVLIGGAFIYFGL